MTGFIEENRPLPLFREDLELYQGPDEVDGSPSYNLFDPSRARYFKTTWGESLILQHLRPGMTLAELVEEINTESTLRVTPEQVKHFFEDALQHNLLAVARPSEQYIQQAEKKKAGFLAWILQNYLYFRIPLVNPDKFLTNTLKYVLPFASQTAFIIYGLATVVGILLLLGRFGEYIHTFSYFFNFQGVIAFLLTISGVKVIHELSHAYTAKRYGIHVPTMGVAMIVLWPMLYTDVTNGWKLWSRKQRLAISAAGITAELIIAGVSTLLWTFTESGILQSVFFLTSSATWVSSLMININPAMRFDGYYLLSDLWGIDNLQTRAFAVARWRLWQFFFGLQTPPPEEDLTPKRINGMLLYSVFTWIYRFFLYLSIAIFVYLKFTKALGVFLFSLEIWVFIIWPIITETQSLFKLRKTFQTNYRFLLTTSLFGAFLVWFVLPWPHGARFDAITAPIVHQVLYVPFPSEVQEIHVKRGDTVAPGDVLAKLYSKKLENRIEATEVQQAIILKQMGILGFAGENRVYLPEKEAQLGTVEEEITRLHAENEELTLIAQIPGKIFNWDQGLKVGQAVPKDKVIGEIADPAQVEVVSFIPEAQLYILQEGQEADFLLLDTHKSYPGTLTKITPVRAENLHHLPLASIYEGPLAVAGKPGTAQEHLRLIKSYYEVTVTLKDPTEELRFGQTGVIEVTGPWRSKFVSMIRYLLNLIWRESGF